MTTVLSLASHVSEKSPRLEKRVKDLRAWPGLRPSNRRLLTILETVRVQRCEECLSKCKTRDPKSGKVYCTYTILRDETCSNLNGGSKPSTTNINPVVGGWEESGEKLPDNAEYDETVPRPQQAQDDDKHGPAISAWTKLGAVVEKIERTVKMPMPMPLVAPGLRFAPP
ncbi:MAG: hypothetical protein M1816_000947 [Peltula sp. TS41687]|nr:MAG: hypothetical protein M1816_000947 [Peltula sp. TS41687]